jgi:nitroreductase
MDFQSVVRKQRMTRRYEGRAIPRETLDRILASGQKAPSAGFSQGVAMVVLEGDDTDVFWKLTTPQMKWEADARPWAVVVPLASKKAYIDRYNLPDKARAGLQKEEAWPVPYWQIDCAFSSMMIMLSATAEGLGCWFFGLFRGKDELLKELGIPDEWEPIGAMTIGYAAKKDVRSPSLKLGRKPFEDFVHQGRW